jgi:riboflavin kinase/FMN adenylyltransferase
MDVAFIGWIRPEMRFEKIEALVEKMDEDCRLARAVLARTPDGFPALGQRRLAAD